MSRRPLKVLFVAAEARPLVQVGGLADVAGDLPRFLARLGHDVRLAIPNYASIVKEQRPFSPEAEGAFSVPFMGSRRQATIHQTSLGDNVPVYLVGSRRYFGRPEIYGGADEVERFFFFSHALLAWLRKLDWQPHILHFHDWHVAAAVCLLRTVYGEDLSFDRMASVFTIHNLGYQGWFDRAFAEASGLLEVQNAIESGLRDRFSSMMGLGIYYADVITTVSQTYSREILTPEQGQELDPVLRLRQKDLYGVVNGLDYEVFNPATDPRLPYHYDSSSIKARAKNKAALQERAGLPAEDIPLIGMVSRLAEQKGVDLVAPALAPLLENGSAQLVFLGSGDERYRQMVAGMVARYPGKATFHHGFDPSLAQLIYAGSDLFLMPSRYEPCGLGQLIAQRYGSIPLVRRTGGLAETVEDASPALDRGTGFVFEEFSVPALSGALDRALSAWQRRAAWARMVHRAMSLDFSWGPSARRYEEVYRKALASRNGRRLA